MSNPYHDENGRFCSKGEMLAAVNKLAQNKDVAAYLELKESYEKLVKIPETSNGSIDVSSAFKKPGPAVDTVYENLVERYSKSSPEWITESMYYKIIEEKGSPEENAQTIHAALEGSNYHPEVMKSLYNEFYPETSLEKKLELALKHYPQGLSYLSSTDVTVITDKYKSKFESAIRDVAKRTDLDNDSREELDNMVEMYASAAKSNAELEFALDHAVYDYSGNSNARVAIAKNPHLGKDIAIKMLDKEIDNGGAYEKVRGAMTSNLRERGISVKARQDSIFTPLPIDDAPSRKALQTKANAQKEISKYAPESEKDDSVISTHAYTDIYAKNYEKLQDDLKKKRLSTSERVEIKTRLILADRRLKDLADYDKFRGQLKTIDFSSPSQ